MKRRMRIIAAIAFVIVTVWMFGMRQSDRVTPVLPVLAETEDAKTAAQFVGTWRLVSIDDKRTVRPENEFEPAGYIIYDATGHMAVQITRRGDRAKFGSDDITKFTTQEKASAFSSYAAYYGSYKVDETEGTVTHYLEGSLTPNDVGKQFVRRFKLAGDRITLSPVESNDAQGTPQRSLTWERVK